MKTFEKYYIFDYCFEVRIVGYIIEPVINGPIKLSTEFFISTPLFLSLFPFTVFLNNYFFSSLLWKALAHVEMVVSCDFIMIHDLVVFVPIATGYVYV